MLDTIEDRNVRELRPLAPPAALKAALPLGPRAASTVRTARDAIRDAIHGKDPRRQVVIAGPCSIHDPDAALEYAARLARLAATLSDELVIVMRTYFEKPRTIGGLEGLS